MRYLSENTDGSVALWACVPLRLIHVDGAVLTVHGIRRKNGFCWLYGGTGTGDSWEVAVGDDSFDVSDMPSDHLPGYVIEWPDFDRDIKGKLPPETGDLIASHRVLTRGEIPADRRFRGAWRDGKGSVAVDMPAAREIHRDFLRAARAPLLAKLDIEYQRADEAGDRAAKTRIAAAKQALRDVTAAPEIDAATTPEELVVPDILTKGTG